MKSHLKKSGIEFNACKLVRRIKWFNGKMPPYDGEYYEWCKTMLLPYVRITLANGGVEILLDCPMFPSKMDKLAQSQVNGFFERWNCPHLRNYFDSINISVREVPVEFMDEMSTELFAIALSFGWRSLKLADQIDSSFVRERPRRANQSKSLGVLVHTNLYECVLHLKGGRSFRSGFQGLKPPTFEFLCDSFRNSPLGWNVVE